MLTKQEILQKLDIFITEEHKAISNYNVLLQEVSDYIKHDKGVCLPDSILKALLDLGSIPHDEFKHAYILEQIKCIME